ncbi:unnamed protein product, partial [Polarella glacialis]
VGELPPLQAVVGARTPLESLTMPNSTMPSSNPAAATALVGGGDVLQQLQALQLAEKAATGGDPRRHWGENERLVRDLLEELSQGSPEPDQREDLVEALSTADAMAVDGDGFGLLHYAAMYGDADAVSTLIRRRANVNCRTKVHETPLQLAAYYRQPEVCAVLLTHRARSDLADWQGRTALAAAKASKCGRSGEDSDAQARCVNLLEEVDAKLRAAGPPAALEELRTQGNGFFKKKSYADAVAAYSLGLAHSEDAGLYANRAACYLEMGKHMEAKLDAKKAVGLAGDAGHLKASWRLAKSCLTLGELDGADEALSEALAKFPEDAALRQLRNEVTLERRRRLST